MFLDEFFLYLYLSHQNESFETKFIDCLQCQIELDGNEWSFLRKISRTRKSPAAGMLMAACIAVPRVEVNNTKGL